MFYTDTGADTGFSSGGDKSGAPVPPPLSTSGGGKNSLRGGGQNSRGRGKSSDISKYRYLDVLNSNSYSNVRYNQQFTIFNDF